MVTPDEKLVYACSVFSVMCISLFYHNKVKAFLYVAFALALPGLLFFVGLTNLRENFVYLAPFMVGIGLYGALVDKTLKQYGKAYELFDKYDVLIILCGFLVNRLIKNMN